MQSLHLLSVFILILPCFAEIDSHANEIFREFYSDDYGDPLYLTPYIESGELQKAKTLSRVGPLPNAPDVLSYSGYFTVNKLFNSNLFFWFFPAMNGNSSAPLLVWLNGGPGASSLMGLFVENGPYYIDATMKVTIRPHHWTQYFQVLYIDNPVGTGFSFTDSAQGYVTNQTGVANDLYEMLQQFFTVFKEYRNNDFYLTGESYAGKYVPALAYKIHTKGPSSRINLKGIALGNAMCDPETMLGYPDYFYQLGLIDRKQHSVLQDLSDSILADIHRRDYYQAVVGMTKLIVDFRVLGLKSYFSNYTDYTFFYNHLYSSEPEDFKHFPTYLESPQSRKAIHVGNLTYSDGLTTQKYLLLDVMQSVKPWVAVLMDNYKVLMYSGELDLIIPYPLSVNFLQSVKWKYAEEYRDAERQIWRLQGTDEIAGYVHQVGDFYEVLVRNAGHILPYDQPKFALDLITRFINNQPYS